MKMPAAADRPDSDQPAVIAACRRRSGTCYQPAGFDNVKRQIGRHIIGV
jgi:hypothetical protein